MNMVCRGVKDFFALGTYNRIEVFDRAGEAALDDAVKRVRDIERKMTVFSADSDIARLNGNAGKGFVSVSAETEEVLRRAREIAEASDGAFDVTLRPLVALWGVGHKESSVPDENDIERLLPLVDFRDVLLDGGCGAALRRSGQAVDLGGIAKGYAADEVKKLLVMCGVKSALINLGGNIVTVGSHPEKGCWEIGVQTPDGERGEYFGVLKINEGAVVTSGGYERFFIENGARFHHILNPKTGHPAQRGLKSATVICRRSIDADALSTAFFVLGTERGLPMLKKYDADAVYVTDEGNVYGTSEDLQKEGERQWKKKR